MNIVDIFIFIFLLIQARRWYSHGFSRGFFSLAGFWLGLIIGTFVSPVAGEQITDPFVRLTVILAIIFISGSLLSVVGQTIGNKLAKALHWAKLNRADRLFGATFGVGLSLILVWLFASVLSTTPFPDLNKRIANSFTIRKLSTSLPPAPEILGRLSSVINPSIFPQVFIGPEPQQIEPVTQPSSAEVAAALETAGKSTVRIESAGCGGRLFGSGFVGAPDLVVTNAHVVAGATDPSVVDVDGSRSARVVYFDPDLDIAILRTEGLAGEPLRILPTRADRGVQGITLGYPGGGPLEADPAAVLRAITARGRNIYNRGVVDRSVFILQTQVNSGNSGGPVVLTDGTVIGVIFAKSQTDPNIGYAITSDVILPLIAEAERTENSVGTSRCVS